MTDKRLKHVEEQLIKVVDRIAENEIATAAEVEALVAVANVLVKLARTQNG